MKLSELIKLAQETIDTHGDLTVVYHLGQDEHVAHVAASIRYTEDTECYLSQPISEADLDDYPNAEKVFEIA